MRTTTVRRLGVRFLPCTRDLLLYCTLWAKFERKKVTSSHTPGATAGHRHRNTEMWGSVQFSCTSNILELGVVEWWFLLIVTFYSDNIFIFLLHTNTESSHSCHSLALNYVALRGCRKVTSHCTGSCSAIRRTKLRVKWDVKCKKCALYYQYQEDAT